MHKVIVGDSRFMEKVGDESVQLVVTSPPYWQLKDYGNSQQIGFDDTYEDYINNLNLTWRECHRVLQEGCRLCVNVGDQYARSVYYGRYKVIPIRTEVIKFCEAIGFDYMGAIIWQKVGTMNTTGGGAIMGSYPYPRNGILKLDYEFILLFKKPLRGSKERPVSKELKEQSKLTKEEWNDYFKGHWNFAGARQDKHLAMFPLELPHRLIKMFTYKGETVLDPFLGSGTTSLASFRLGRSSLGYEINSDYIDTIRDKLSGCDLIVEEQQPKSTLFHKARMKDLPYCFKDMVRLNKKIDVKALQFGSKIDADSPSKETHFTVKKVLSPDFLLLGDNLKIRLMGIRAKEHKETEAIEFLEEKVLGQRVFMRYDTIKHDDNKNPWCYLYLRNKTFINAHLLKQDLADVDTSIDFKYRSKFITLGGANNA